MSKTNRMDRITDLTKMRVERIVGVATKQFKGANPYRQVIVSPEERIQKYLSTSPEQIQFMRQNFGDQAVDTYIAQMNALIGGQSNGT